MIHHENQESLYQPNPETVSPDRPPQLNETVCGCRCGCGCSCICEGDDGGKNDDDAASTLVASDNSEMGEDFGSDLDNSEHVNGDIYQSRSSSGVQLNELAARFRRFVNGTSQHVVGLEDLSARPHRVPSYHNFDDIADSMSNGPCGSDDHSVVASDHRIVRHMSPGPGIGDWADEVPVEYRLEIPLEYHFVVKPLRLTPQHRYCRGLMASHLVVRDEVTFMDMDEQE